MAIPLAGSLRYGLPLKNLFIRGTTPANSLALRPPCHAPWTILGPSSLRGFPRTYDWIIPLLFPDENETSRQRHAAELSPLLSIAGSTSPIFISHGIGDEVVPIAQSRALMSSLERSHVRAILVTFDGGHEFAGINPSTKDTILAQQLAFILQSAPNGMRQIAAASSP